MTQAHPSLREHALVMLAFLAISVLATWPLAAHLSDGVLGPPGDNYEYLYKIWWFTTALGQGASPLTNPNVFYPAGYDVSLSETTLANMALALPFAALWGEVVAYNVVVLLTFALSGWAAYVLVRSLTGSRAGAAVAGLIFAFSPFRMAHLGAGHLPLLGTQWIPLAFLFVERAIRSRRAQDGALAGLFYGLTALSSWYYAYMIGLFLALFALVRWLQVRKEVPAKRLAAAGLSMVAVAGVVMLPAAVPLLRNAGAGATAYSDLAYVDQWSASVADFFWPSVLHPIWGRALAEVHMPNVHEGVLYLGWAAIGLAALGAWKWRAQAKRAYAWLGVVAFVLALGTTLHFAGGPVHVPVPDAVEQVFARGMNFLTSRIALNPLSFAKMRTPGAVVAPMPGLLLYLFAPFFTAMRVPARFQLGLTLATAVLAGGGVAFLVAQVRKGWAQVGVAGALGLLVMVDLASAPFAVGYSEARAQPVDAWLAAQPHPSPVAQLPLDRTWYGYPLYQQRFHGQPIVYGYGTFVPPSFRATEEAMRGFPDAASFDALQGSGAEILLLAENSFGEAWPAVERAMQDRREWTLVGKFADEPLFHDGGLMAMAPPNPAVPPSEWIAGDKTAYIEDTIWVYQFAGREGP